MSYCKRRRSIGDSGDGDLDQKSTTAITNNDDLITEILLRLPIKSVIRFKSVNKHWLSLLSSPHFACQHFHRNPNYTVSGFFLQVISGNFDFIFINRNADTTPNRSFNFINKSKGESKRISIQHSCNGLLLCYRKNKDRYQKATYYVCNPTTKQYTTLPPVPNRVQYIHLAFDPCKSPHYKAVCVRDNSSKVDGDSQIEIYSSETRQWKLSGDPFDISDEVILGRGVFWNGAIHWISKIGPAIYFDVEQERVRTMPMPPPFPEGKERRRYRYFGASRRHMHLIEIDDVVSTRFDILEMERDYSRWTVKYNVDLEPVTIAYPDIVFDLLRYGSVIILCFLPSEEEEEEDEGPKLVLRISGETMSYNLKDKTLRKLNEFSCRDFSPRSSLDRNKIIFFSCLPERIDSWDDLFKYNWKYVHEHVETLFCV